MAWKSNGDEYIDEAPQVANDLVGSQLRLTIDPINESNRHLLDSEAQDLGSRDYLHLKAVSSCLDFRDDCLQHVPLVKAE